MADAAQIAQRTHPDYDENINKWELYRDASKGGEDFINDTYLHSHRLEDTEDFNERLDRGYYLNFCDTIPTIYNNYIFKEEINRPPTEQLELFKKNVDGRNSNINAFIERVGYYASVYGVVHVLVDMPESNKKSPSKADDKEANRVPYCSIILPTSLKDWSVDEKGRFNWVIIEFIYYDDSDPTLEREEHTYYKIITREKWWVEDEDGNTVSFKDGTASSGTNELGIIPIVTMYHKDTGNDKIGESLIKDIVYINKTIMNWCSCIDEQIERQTFSQLVIPDDAAMDEDEERGDDPLFRFGTSSAFTFNPESRHAPMFISPNTENISVVWALVSDHIKEIYRLGGLQGGTSDLYTSRSGRQSQMSFSGVNSSLSKKSSHYEKFENDVSKIALLMLGGSINEYSDVKYPTSFDIAALADELESLIKILERNFSATLNKTIEKGIARKTVSFADVATRKAIEDEIENSDGIVEPIKASVAGVQPEKNGDGNPNNSAGNSNKTKQQSDEEETSHRTVE